MLHIDGDIIAYRIACAIGDDGEAAAVPYTTNSFVGGHILAHFPELTDYQVYLSGETNFRDEIAVTSPYKGNRDPNAKPKLLPVVRQHLVDVWGAKIYEGYEADDAIACAAVQDKDAVICSIDKDFNQLAVKRFNFVTNEFIHPSPWEATLNLYAQCLTGDTVDNIIGVEGIGDATAMELLSGCTKVTDAILICIDQLGLDRFRENIQLVFLWRNKHQGYFDWVNGLLQGHLTRILGERFRP